MEAYIEVAKNDNNFLLVNYSEGILPIMEKVSKITNTTFTDLEWKLINERAHFHGKYPGQYFSEDQGENIIPGNMEKAFTLYNTLEQLRTT